MWRLSLDTICILQFPSPPSYFTKSPGVPKTIEVLFKACLQFAHFPEFSPEYLSQIETGAFYKVF